MRVVKVAVQAVGFGVEIGPLTRSPAASPVPTRRVSPRGGVLANFLQRLPTQTVANFLGNPEIRTLRVRPAMGENASIRVVPAVFWRVSKNQNGHLEEPRAAPTTGDLAQIAPRSLRTTWRKPRVWRRSAANLLMHQPLQYPEDQEE